MIGVLAPERFGDRPNVYYFSLIEDLLGFDETIERAGESDSVPMPTDEIAALRSRFTTGLEPGESLIVQTPFDVDGVTFEVMWVSVQVWSQMGVIKGTLVNEPQMALTLRLGEIVEVDESKLVDWRVNRF